MTRKELEKEIGILKANQTVMEARLAAIEANDSSASIAEDRRLQIKMIARAAALGDHGPRKAWNRMRKFEIEHGKG